MHPCKKKKGQKKKRGEEEDEDEDEEEKTRKKLRMPLICPAFASRSRPLAFFQSIYMLRHHFA